MKAYLLIALAFGFLGFANGLQCWTCRNARSSESCDRFGSLEKCQYNQQACQTVHRRVGYFVVINKHCKQAHACEMNQAQNDRPSGKSTQCNTDQTNSVCRCCCKEDKCNMGGLQCTSSGDEVCPALQPVLYGNTDCTRGNSSGSVCSFNCNRPGYFVHPPRHTTAECFTNGRWSNPAPCCARQCPPFLLFDSVILFHADEPRNSGAMMMLAEIFRQSVEIGQDSIRLAGAYFSGVTMITSRIRFSDYTDSDSLRRLVINRLQNPKNTEDGMVNATSALEFTMNNLLVPEAGMRGPEVPKKITIMTNQDPHDDTAIYARQLRNNPDLPVEILMLGFQNEGEVLDFDKMVDITGSPEKVFIFENDPTKINADSITGIHKFLCTNPCRHVLPGL